jgi:thiol-disulfide isomerase/thioredoxin
MANNMANKAKTFLGVFALFIVLLVGLMNWMSGEWGVVDTRGAAPELSFKLENKEVKLSDFKGKVVLVNFWAYWCGPCTEEMPILRRLEEKMTGRNFQLLAFHVGAFEGGTMYPPLFPKNLIYGLPPESISKFRVSALPHSNLIDAKGEIRKTYMGAQDWMGASFLRELESLL